MQLQSWVKGLVTAVLWLLLGCSCAKTDSTQTAPLKAVKPVPSDMPDTAATQTHPSDNDVRRVTARLGKQGITVLSVGQNYRVIIPAIRLFGTGSPNTLWSGYNILNGVVDYIKLFQVATVRIVTYVADKDQAIATSLAAARSKVVATYLWDQGIDARLLYSQSQALLPLAHQHCSRSGVASAGDYVEIIFKRLMA